MRHKEFTKKQAKSKIKEIIKYWKKYNLDGEHFSLSSIIGDYKNNSMNRFIKETLFYNDNDGSSKGATWYLKYPKAKSKKLTKKVMKAINVTRY